MFLDDDAVEKVYEILDRLTYDHGDHFVMQDWVAGMHEYVTPRAYERYIFTNKIQYFTRV